MSELLPCPFCGGEAGLHPTYDMDTNEVDGWFVWCGNDHCDCMPETNQHLTEAEAIAAWNTRAERTCKIFRVSNTRDIRECSACGKHIYLDNAFNRNHLNYCPNCGARVIA